MTVIGAGPDPAPQPAPEEPERRRRNTPELRRRIFIALIAVWAVAITAVVLFRGSDEPAAAPAAPPVAPSASDAPLSVAEVYRTLLPSVVRIETSGKAAGTSMNQSATGTGVIANADGTILTALHVVDGAQQIKISYADGSNTTATVASADGKQDIAMLTPAKLPETLVPAVLGGGAQVGDDVVAIGNPLGLTATTTSGVVSGLGRVMSRDAGGPISGLIQFDAAVNPGSSGGPLLNDRGQVIGIVIALANPTEAGTFIGIGFAVPIGSALGGGEGDGQAPPL
jgi:S1-C subfamily serine protease